MGISSHRVCATAISSVFFCQGGAAWAQDSPSLADVEIREKASSQPAATRVTEDVQASPASTTVIDRAQLSRQTTTTYGDIFRNVPGFSVVEYQQGLVAYGMTIRGFDSDHGRNIAVFLDGMPLNVTGSQHTNGYADLAQVIPELLNRVEVVRGPFSIFAGNHAVAGSVQMYTDASPPSSVKISVDNFGRTRLVPIYTFGAGPGKLLVAADLTKGSGYSDQSQLQRTNLFTRYTMPLGNGLASARLQLYDAQANAPGYLDAAKVNAGTVSLKDFLSRGIGDAKSQQNLVFNYRSYDLEGSSGLKSGWAASLYFNNDNRKRWVNFDLTTPDRTDNAPLRQERDLLQQAGFDVHKTSSFSTAGLPSQLVAGAQFNNEDINATRYLANPGRDQLPAALVPPGAPSTDRRTRTRTESLYGQYQIAPIELLKITAGLRYDRIATDIHLRPADNTFAAAVAAGQATNVSQSAGQFSPKLGAALTIYDAPSQSVEIYANYARGLKSPYPYDIYNNLGVGNIPGLSISSVNSYELGLQGSAKNNTYRWRAGVWSTRQSNEGDVNAAGIFQSFKKTHRDGFDVDGSVLVAKDTRLIGSFSKVNAQIQDPVAAGFDHVPNVPEYLATLGVNSLFRYGGQIFDLSLMTTLVGPQSVTTDNLLRTRHFYRSIARASYTRDEWRGAQVFLNVVHYSRQADEYVVDFGGGTAGTPVAPKVRATLGVQVPL